MTYEIPLKPYNQAATVVLAGVTYNLRLTWNVAESLWILDIYDAAGNPLVMGSPLVAGADLLAQYQYLNFGGKLFVATDGDVNAPPTYDDLGQTAHLYFQPDP